MKKISIIVVVSLLSLAAAKAQYGLAVSYQMGFTGKNGYSSDMKTSALGVQGKLTYSYDDYLRFHLGVGYYLVPFENLNVDGVKVPIDGVTLSVIPVTLGGQFFLLSKKYKPFVGMEMGWAYTIESESIYRASTARNNFITAPEIGLAYEVSDNMDVFASVKQNIVIYSYRDYKEHTETFVMTGFHLGLNYRF